MNNRFQHSKFLFLVYELAKCHGFKIIPKENELEVIYPHLCKSIIVKNEEEFDKVCLDIINWRF